MEDILKNNGYDIHTYAEKVREVFFDNWIELSDIKLHEGSKWRVKDANGIILIK